jgi:hypothetical protein
MTIPPIDNPVVAIDSARARLSENHLVTSVVPGTKEAANPSPKTAYTA